MAERVGFMGLGAIGRAIAKHLAQRFETVVWNRTAAKAQEFAKATGARVADSPGALVKQVDVVITCLPTSREVWEGAEAASGAGGAAGGGGGGGGGAGAPRAAHLIIPPTGKFRPPLRRRHRARHQGGEQRAA